MQLKFAVTGATGYIGQATVQRLNSLDYQVLAITRCLPLKLKNASSNIKWIQTIDDVPTEENLANVDAIIHLAGRAHTKVVYENGKNLFDEANCELAIKTATTSLKAGVKRFVFVSTLGVHGNWSNKQITEESLMKGDTAYARSKIAAEKELKKLFSDKPNALTIVRPPIVYGSHCPGNFSRLVKLVRTGLPLPFGSVKNIRSFIYIENLADFLVYCAVTKNVNGTFVLGDGSDFTLPYLIQNIANGLAVRARLFSFPPSILRLAALPISKKRELESLTKPMEVNWSRAKEAGWLPPIKPTDAFAGTLKGYQN